MEKMNTAGIPVQTVSFSRTFPCKDFNVPFSHIISKAGFEFKN